MALDDLRVARERGKSLQKSITRVVACAEERSAFPGSRTDLIRNANDADWTWRPDIWRTAASPVGWAELPSGEMYWDAIKVFHDCDLCENALRQVPNTRSVDLAPYGLRLDVLAFSGSFLSIVVDLPEVPLAGLSKQHVVRVDADIDSERAVKTFARLNLRQGPNVETMVAEFQPDHPAVFDLGFSDVNENLVDAAWVEIIFENPAFNEILLRDFTLCRHSRAEI